MSIRTADLILVQEIIDNIAPGSKAGPESFELNGGFTGSKVFYLYIDCSGCQSGNSVQGHSILKISEVRPYKRRDEAACLSLCRDHAPGFMARFSPELHPSSGAIDKRQYLLLGLANPAGIGKTYTLASVDDHRLTDVVRRLCYRLHTGFEGDGTGLNPTLSWLPVRVSQVLAHWLGSGVPKAYESRIGRLFIPYRNYLEEECKTKLDRPLFAGRELPRPEGILKSKAISNSAFRAAFGLLHGDIHLGNVLCKEQPRVLNQDHVVSPDEFSLIDFEKARLAPVLYDQAYLQMSLVCALSVVISDETLWLLLTGSGPATRDSEGERAVRAVDDSMSILIAENKGVYPDLLIQWNLARFAAAVNWATKNFKPDEYYKSRRAYLVAALRFQECSTVMNLPVDDKRLAPDSEGFEIAHGYDPGRHTQADKEAAAVSGFLLINALLRNDYSWDSLNFELSELTFRRLREGSQLDSADLRRIERLAEKTDLFEDVSHLAEFFRVDAKDFKRRRELVGSNIHSACNRELCRLVDNKIFFDEGSWLQKEIQEANSQHTTILQTLREAAIPNDDGLSLRTWNLRRAYYHAGIQLNADQMADAAVADFSHSRWERSINSDPKSPSSGIAQLMVANERIGQLVVDELDRQAQMGKVTMGPDATVKVVEGGSGGGHTTYFLLNALRQRECHIEYRGIEVVPALAAGLDALLNGNADGDGNKTDSRRRLVADLGRRLKPLRAAGDQKMVITDKMEDAICDLWDRFSLHKNGTDAIDVFVSSFAYHHVPNGDAIIRYLSNDAQGYADTLDREPVARRQRISQAIASKCKELYAASTASEGELRRADGLLRYRSERQRIIEDTPKDLPQVAVFLSLLEPSALTDDLVEKFCESILRHHTYSSEAIRHMLRNPQRDVLLTAQALLRDGGILVIADPDGTSNFNAKNAAADHELTIANFLNSGELRSMLEDIGFDGIKVYRLEDTGSGCKIAPESKRSTQALGFPDLGYIVFARRDTRRERELADVRTREHSIVNLDAREEELKKAEADVTLLGRLLREEHYEDQPTGLLGSDIVRRLFVAGDSRPYSGRVFRNHPLLRRLLHSLNWLELANGSSVIANRRIHVFEPTPRGASKRVFIATDFPETPQEARNSEQRIFSHRDEADVFLQKTSLDSGHEPAHILDLCCGAGTLGVIFAVKFPSASVLCVDSQQRSLDQVRVNALLNGVLPRISSSLSQREDPWSFKQEEPARRFDLILADPPFSLRPDFSGLGDRADDGGPTGDEKTRLILLHAERFLSARGKLFLLAYSLRRHKDHTGPHGRLMVNEHLRPKLRGSGFEPVDSKVWRYRHDKIIDQLSVEDNLRYLVIRVGDPTRPESMIYSSSKEQEQRFKECVTWLEDLNNREWTGLALIFGRFERELF